MWKAELVRDKLSYLRISPSKILMVPLGFFLLLGIKCVKKERIWGGKKCWTRRNQNLSWCLFSLSLILRFTQLLFVSIVHTFVFRSVQLLSHVRLFAIPWAAAHQAFLSVVNFRSLLKLMSIELVMPSNHLILCRPLLLLPSIFPNNRVFSNESVLHITWPKHWSFIFSITHFSEYSGLIFL